MIADLHRSLAMFKKVKISGFRFFSGFRLSKKDTEGDTETILINPHWETQGSQESPCSTWTFRRITADKGN